MSIHASIMWCRVNDDATGFVAPEISHRDVSGEDGSRRCTYATLEGDNISRITITLPFGYRLEVVSNET